MVRRQIESRGLTDPRILAAMRTVPRENFVPPHLAEDAYDDSPLPIAGGQTISQPYIVAFMIDALQLQGDESVLEIGTGSGYAAAVLSQIVQRVLTIERLANLAAVAEDRLVRLGCHNVEVRTGDGTLGAPDRAPFEAIVVTASGPRVPESLTDQLAVNGRLVMPVASSEDREVLVRVTRRSDGEFDSEDLSAVRFVPLIGKEGWPGDVTDPRGR